MGIALCSAAMAELCFEEGSAESALGFAETAQELYGRLGMRRELVRFRDFLEHRDDSDAPGFES